MVRSSPRKAKQPVIQSTKVETGVKATSRAKEVASKVKAIFKTATKRKSAPDEDEGCTSHAEDDEKPVTKKQKSSTKQNGSGATMKRAERTAVSSLKRAMYLGAHVSAAGGVHNALTNALDIGANSVALFLKSQRKWESPPLDPSVRDQFRTLATTHAYSATEHILPHGSYLVNLAAKDPSMAAKAYNGFLDDLQRCEQLGIKLYNFHPGNTNGEPRKEAIARLAAALNRSHKATKTVVTVLENMAGSGNVIGSTWEDLRDVIALVDDKKRVGVCIDTCHTFAAGYDLRSPAAFEKTMEDFDEIVGSKYLKAFHLNDSKAPLNSKRDLHANIGTGFLGLRAFHNIMNYEPFQNLPMVLETPIDRKGPDGKVIEDKQVWADEIKLLEGLIGVDPEGDDFKTLERELAAKGAEERAKFQDQADRKKAKDAKKGAKKNGAAQKAKPKKKKTQTSDEDSE